MELGQIFQLYQLLKEDTLSFFYQGSFSDEITDKIIGLSEYSISMRQDQARMSSKVSFLMAECFQNVVRHGTEADTSIIKHKYTGMFSTRHIGTSYYIASCNLVKKENIDFLTSRIDEINRLDKDDLKKMYLENLEHEGLSSKGGAGLGLIEMARKSGQKLEYLFEPFDQDFSFFYLQIKMKSLDLQGQNGGISVPIHQTVAFHHLMMQNNFLLMHKGDYSRESVIPILRMLENNLRSQSDVYKYKKKVFHVLVEILQNISIHSFAENGIHHGIFVLGMKDESFHILAGNFVAADETDELRTRLDQLNSMNKEDLNSLYKATLRQGKGTRRGGAGLGLIDIARESLRKIDYQLYPADDKKAFFLMSVNIR
ncbi:MAG TPA: SiaB family protein kinase [Bacteroidales bacterium]|nr:hypothetical protein [Bacteroidales bacterium]HQK37500.1 SiaB family protein kinase [Bacteroidales bacterium]